MTSLTAASPAAATVATLVPAPEQFHDPYWMHLVQVFGTPGVAVVAALVAGAIAYRQWRTAQNKLKWDLFDRRLAVFEAAEALIKDSYVDAEDWKNREAVRSLRERMAGSRWLLNIDISNYLAGIGEEAEKRLKADPADTSDMTPEQRSAAHAALMRERRKRVEKEMSHLIKLFDPFLSVEH